MNEWQRLCCLNQFIASEQIEIFHLSNHWNEKIIRSCVSRQIKFNGIDNLSMKGCMDSLSFTWCFMSFKNAFNKVNHSFCVLQWIAILARRRIPKNRSKKENIQMKMMFLGKKRKKKCFFILILASIMSKCIVYCLFFSHPPRQPQKLSFECSILFQFSLFFHLNSVHNNFPWVSVQHNLLHIMF